MIQLSRDSLVFQMSDGDSIPCTAEAVTIELIGEAAQLLDPELIRHAARAVLHYFKIEQGRDFVSLGEFSQALTTVLRGFGLAVEPAPTDPPGRRVAEADLRRLACESGKAFELGFFPRLRDELRRRLGPSPQVLRFKGLRGCVKQLTGARRWSRRCQQLSDQIVEYLRGCLHADVRSSSCSLVVQ